MRLDVTPLAATGYERIGEADRRQYAEQGWLLIRNALDEPMRQRVTDAVDRVYAEESEAGRVKADGAAHVMGCLARDPALTDLVDHPTTFPYIWGLLGWNIYSHHSHVDVNPPVADPGAPFWNWHQDGYRQNSDIDMNPRPMLSAKICYVLSDLSEPGRGSTRIIPGSHLDNTLAGRPERPGPGFAEPEGAIEILANPGDAFIFDRRLWHSRSVNPSGVTRKLVFIGYTYRWIRPLDEVAYDQAGRFWRDLSPVQRQLLGGGGDNANFWGIRPDGWIDDAIPLRDELKWSGMLDRAVPYLR
jgi:ectoine hydroxylase-related dioxygenase (phytanoyl-CoA dioxygenase family)